MKNSIYSKREVPSIHPGCSLAETGAGDYDDFDNPLGAFDIVSEEKKKEVLTKKIETWKGYDGECTEVEFVLKPEIKFPSSVRNEHLKLIPILYGDDPFISLKNMGIDFENSWVLISGAIVDALRKKPCSYHHETIAYGEFFRFLDGDEISLQNVKYFEKWKIILEGKICGKEFYRADKPTHIYEVFIAR